jgi:phage minor structural protein
MRLLSGHSLTPVRTIPLESMQLSLKEREATANIVPADMDGIVINAWLQDDTNPGQGIVWRVKSIKRAFDTDTYTVQLEHVIASLKDLIMFGEITPGKMSGKSTDKECTAKQAITYILKQCADWTVGTVDYTDKNPYKFDGDTLYDALDTVSDSLDEPVWSYDFSSYPFKLSITKRNNDVTSEMRANRNLRTISRTVDTSGMYTRFYPIGKDDLHISGNYVEKNTATYGVISRVETDQSLDTKNELKRWANQRLKRHAQPTVTIEIEGYELADATGEPLDRLTLNRVMRVPLPEFGTTIQERITALSYADKIRQPEVVKVTLANTRTDITRIIADMMKSGGKGSRTSSRKGAEDRAWMEDTNDHVALCAKGIIGVDAQGNPNWERLSKIVVDGKGIHQTVTDIQEGQKKFESRIDQDEKKIGLVVGSYDNGGNYIKAGQICLAINGDNSSSALIQADKIKLEGNVSLNDTMKVTEKSVYIKMPLRANGGVMATELQLRDGNNDERIQAKDLPKMIKSVDVSGNTLTLKEFGGKVWTFSKAITSWDFGWSSGTLTVTVQPGNQKTPNADKRTLATGTATRDGTRIKVPINAKWGSSQQYTESTGWSVTVNVANVFNSISMTRISRAYVGPTGIASAKGTLYYYDAQQNKYIAASSNEYYWYYSSTSRSGSYSYYY